MHSNPRTASHTRDEGDSARPACRESGQILQDVGGAGQSSGLRGPRGA
jgi:hypothetical protein